MYLVLWPAGGVIKSQVWMNSGVIILVGNKMLRSIVFYLNYGWPFDSDVLLAVVTKRSIRRHFFKLLLMILILKMSGNWRSSWWIWLAVDCRLWICLPVWHRRHPVINLWTYCYQIRLRLNLIPAINITATKYSRVIRSWHSCTATVCPILSFFWSLNALFLYRYHRRQGPDRNIQLLQCSKTVPV